MLGERVATLWAACAGIALFMPAYAVPFFALPLQALDILILVGLPLIVLHWRRLGVDLGLVALGFGASLLMSSLFSGGNILVLIHGLALVVPFLLLVGLCTAIPAARQSFLNALLLGGGLSAMLFFAQLVFGAELLDFRSNTAFSLPPQYGRGFALFPEVSTLAVHLNLVLAVCLALIFHDETPRALRQRAVFVALLMVMALMLSRSTSFLLIAPVTSCLAIAKAQKLRPRALLHLLAFATVAAAILFVFLTQFYDLRLQSSAAPRSAQMRLASMLAGLTPLQTGEVFGVGLGENHEIARRAYDISRSLGLRFGQLPQGVNSQVIARVFEEGWPAVLNLSVALAILLRVLTRFSRDPVVTALTIFAFGSFLMAGLVTGYRGIYTNWIWLALPAGLLHAYTPVRRRTAPTVLSKMPRSTPRPARHT